MKKIYLILGASSDVGMAYIKKLNDSKEDVKVVACYRTESEAFSAALAGATDIDVEAFRVDLGVSGEVEELIGQLKARDIVPTHILHLAAGKFEYMKIKSWDAQKAMEEMQISFFSFARICKEYLPVMAKNKYGKVTAMLTAYVLGKPPKFMSSYIACKSALMGYIKSAAAEYGDKGININGICPGMMETKFLENIDERIVAMSAESSLKKRNTTVQETVDGIYWLMSDEASYVNGTNLNLSGGDYM